MARALGTGGRLITIEVDEEHASFARQRVLESDVADRIELRVGRGEDLLPEIPDMSADAVLVDADKVGYRAYLEQAWRILRPGGLLMADNAFAFGQILSDGPQEASVLAIRDFNDALAKDRRFRSIIVPIGDGLWVSVRQSQSNTHVI